VALEDCTNIAQFDRLLVKVQSPHDQISFHDLLLAKLLECDLFIAQSVACIQLQKPSCVNWDLATPIYAL